MERAGMEGSVPYKFFSGYLLELLHWALLLSSRKLKIPREHFMQR